jgi:hypothetical protein
VNDSGRIRFEIQFRSLSEQNYEEYTQAEPSSSYKGNIKLAGAFIANYCPTCGTRLASLINSSNRDAFLRLAEKHRPFSLFACP